MLTFANGSWISRFVRNKNWIVCFVGLFLAVAGIRIGAVYKYPSIFRVFAWEKVSAYIIRSEIEVQEYNGGAIFNATLYSLLVEYRFVYNDSGYTGNRLSPSRSWTTYSDPWNRYLEKYPVGKRVTAYVNPRDPNESVLERTNGMNEFKTVVMPILFLLIGCSLVAISVYRSIKPPHEPASSENDLQRKKRNAYIGAFMVFVGTLAIVSGFFANRNLSEFWRDNKVQVLSLFAILVVSIFVAIRMVVDGSKQDALRDSSDQNGHLTRE